MIENLLKYQVKDKEKLNMVYGVEAGKVKRELDEANRLLESTKTIVINLDTEAKSIVNAIEIARKNLGELLTRTEEISKEKASGKTEDKLNSAVNYANMISTRLAGYESQLADLTRKIAEKDVAFRDAVAKLQRAQKIIATYSPEYEKQKKELEPKVNTINKELEVLAKGIDAKLLERYKRARGADKMKKPTDVVVVLSGNNCSSCRFELPLSQIHTINTQGYIVCEECGKIIFK